MTSLAPFSATRFGFLEEDPDRFLTDPAQLSAADLLCESVTPRGVTLDWALLGGSIHALIKWGPYHLLQRLREFNQRTVPGV